MELNTKGHKILNTNDFSNNCGFISSEIEGFKNRLFKKGKLINNDYIIVKHDGYAFYNQMTRIYIEKEENNGIL